MSFQEHHFQQGALTVLLDGAYLAGSGNAFGQAYAAAELAIHFASRLACHQYTVCLWNAIARMGQPVGHFPVIGYKDQAVAVEIQATDGKQMFVTLRGDKIDHSGTASRIAVGRHHPNRLVYSVIDSPGSGQRRTVYADLVPGWVDSGAQLRHHAAIHLHPAGHDQLLALPPTSDTGRCQDFLQPLADRLPNVGTRWLGRAVACFAGTL